MFARSARARLARCSRRSIARAQVADGGAPPDDGRRRRAAQPARLAADAVGVARRRARDEFDFGDYERVVDAAAPDRRGARAGARAAGEGRSPRGAARLRHRLHAHRSPAPPPRARSSCCCAKSRRRGSIPRSCAPRRSPSSTRCARAIARSCSPPIARTAARYYWALDLIPLAGPVAEPPVDRRRSSSAPSSWRCSPTNVTTGALLDHYQGDDHTLRQPRRRLTTAARCELDLLRRCSSASPRAASSTRSSSARAAASAIAKPKRASASEARHAPACSPQARAFRHLTDRTRRTLCEGTRLRLAARGCAPTISLDASLRAAIR